MEQASGGLSLVINPLCNTVAPQSMAPLFELTLGRRRSRAADFSSILIEHQVRVTLKSPGASTALKNKKRPKI